MSKIGRPLEVASGIGGRIELYPSYIRVSKGGFFASVFNILGYQSAIMENTIMLERLASVEIVHPILGLSYIHFSYAGAPTRTGLWLRDSFAENGLLLSLVDNRPFHRLVRKLHSLIEEADQRSLEIKGIR
jgi:hypothetical protein